MKDFARKYWWLILAVVIPGGLWLAGGGSIIKLVRRFVNRGKKVNASWPYNKKTGLVEADPGSLAEEAGADPDTFALAVMLSSEVGDEPEAAKIAHAHVALNYARVRGKSISDVLLWDVKNVSHQGFFGSQADVEKTTSSGVHPSDRYASTRNPPYEDDIAIASDATTGRTADPTGGATQFDNPSVEDKLFRAGRTSMDGAGLAAKRVSEGKVAVYVDGLDPNKFRFWRAA